MNPPNETSPGATLDPTRDGPAERRADEAAEDEIPLPIGTLFLMMLYIMVMAGMWFGMYFEFLGR